MCREVEQKRLKISARMASNRQVAAKPKRMRAGRKRLPIIIIVLLAGFAVSIINASKVAKSSVAPHRLCHVARFGSKLPFVVSTDAALRLTESRPMCIAQQSCCLGGSLCGQGAISLYLPERPLSPGPFHLGNPTLCKRVQRSSIFARSF